jgi:ribosomal RNA-processing protein 12
VLSAVEENLNGQNGGTSPVAYLVSFLALLDQSIDSKSDEILDQNLATSSAYFLDLILPFVVKPLLKQKFPEILTKLAQIITNSKAEAPIIKSAIGSLETLLIAQDLNSWSNTTFAINPRRGFGGLLEFSLDPRPKVRKRAQEAVHNILANPPPGPSLEHVASVSAAEFSINSIVELLSSKPNQKANKEHSAKVIHILQLIASITSANTWPSAKIEQLCDILLEISKTNDQYLVSSAFNGFEGLFNSMTDEIDSDKFVKVLNIIFDLKPSVNDSNLAGAWVAVIAKGVSSYSKVEPLKALQKLPEILKILQPFFASESSDIYISASQCVISIFTESVPDNYLLLPTKENGLTGEIYEEVDEVISQITDILAELLTVKYRQATKEILELLTVAFDKFRSRGNPDFLKLLEIVGQWRTNEEFEFKLEAESVIASAITELGPEVVLNTLPLNLLDPSKTGRAWLLPLLRDNVRSARLGYFVQDIIPLIDQFSKKIESLDRNSVHFKIFQTIVDQCWSLLPHFADLPSDLQESFTDEFAQQLAQLLYSNPELRVNICHALRLLVESNLAFANGALSDDKLLSQEFDIKVAESNIEYLSTKSANLLAVLFNVFSQTNPDSRGFVLETIDAYLSISKPEDLEKTFNQVSVLLKNAFDEESKQQQANGKPSKGPKLSVTMLDLVVSMAKYVPESSYNALFTIFNQTISLPDPLLQKRSYRIITKLIETPTGNQALISFVSEIERVLVEATQTVHLSARASRLTAFKTILQILPNDHLFFIPTILSEIILCTKDNNEKTRELSYSILIEMGNKMAEGGIIQNSKIPGFDTEMADSEASLTEYFTMVSAGLAGGAQHMISATITAISCLVFEFKDVIDPELLSEITTTVELFLTSNSKEIVRSTIGFVKIAAVSLPDEIVIPNLRNLLEHLLRWSHEHTGHFKSKVKHIVERLIRRFGFDVIEQNFPEEDKKLLTNIRKTKARAKRRAAEDDAEEGKAQARVKGNSYEDVLYDSEDEEDEEDEEEENHRGKGKKKSSQYILESGNEPLDLLDRQAISHISSTRPNARSSNNRRINASEFEKSADGKFIFNDKFEDAEDPLKAITSGINAYVEAVKSGPVRGQKNKFKFKRGRDAYDEGAEGTEDHDELKKPRFQPSNKSRVGKPGKKPFKNPRKKF